VELIVGEVRCQKPRTYGPNPSARTSKVYFSAPSSSVSPRPARHSGPPPLPVRAAENGCDEAGKLGGRSVSSRAQPSAPAKRASTTPYGRVLAMIVRISGAASMPARTPAPNDRQPQNQPAPIHTPQTTAGRENSGEAICSSRPGEDRRRPTRPIGVAPLPTTARNVPPTPFTVQKPCSARHSSPRSATINPRSLRV
jgi:hypothetical protein